MKRPSRITNPEQTHNTLCQVTNNDFLGFKICISTFMDWYVRNCDIICMICDTWLESEEDTISSILSRGLESLKVETMRIKESDEE